MDVENLYTNIETKKGLEAVSKALSHYPVEGSPDECLLRLLELTLTKNDFEFNREYFLQVKGTAMGKQFAPAYANIYMADWEESVFKKCKILPTEYLMKIGWSLSIHSIPTMHQSV